MRVLMIGCDQLGAELAHRLSDHGHEVVVVDREQAAFAKLSDRFRGRVHVGDALNQEVLQRAGIENADVFLALTRSDTTNFILGLTARERFQISQVIVRNLDPDSQVVCEHMRLRAVSSARWGAEQLEEMISQSDLERMLALGGGEIEIYALQVPKKWSGQKLSEVIPAKNLLVISLTRAGKSTMPSQDTELWVEDVLHIAADHTGSEELWRRLSVAQKGES